MNYKVLYRKYRPVNFNNVIGQKHIIQTLKNSIINNVISHAYIFSGPRGTGKTSTAKIFAKAINCESPIDGSPCENCDFCKYFNENPDIIEIDAASNNGVDEIRNLIDNIKLAPTNGKYKVYIIDEVHMLTTSAFNALLLTLEEPPKHTVFILATTNIESVPITILSRCQRFDFKKISIDDLKQGLKNVCEKENITINEDALTEIAYLSEGGMRDALSILDQLSKNGEEITLELVEKQIKTISQKKIDDLFETLENNDIEEFLKMIDDLKVQAVDYKNLVKKIIFTASKKARNIKLYRKFKRLNYEDYKNIILNLTDSLNKININVDSYMIFEMILLQYFDTKNDSILQKEEIVSVEKQNITTEKEIIPETSINTEINNDFIERRITNCFANAQKNCLENVKVQLKNKIDLMDINGKIKSILLDSEPVVASDKYIVFMVSSEHIATSNNNYINQIEEELVKILENKYRVIFISEDKWLLKRQEYVNNLKSGKHYDYVEEKDDIKENVENDFEINDVFDVSKVEVI